MTTAELRETPLFGEHTALGAKIVPFAGWSMPVQYPTGILEVRSEAIRAALVAAAYRLRDKRTLAAEVAALEDDEDDRAEMLAVADLMESLRAPG